MAPSQWIIVYSYKRKGEEREKAYTTVYCSDDVIEAIEDCRAKYGNAKAVRADKYVPVHE